MTGFLVMAIYRKVYKNYDHDKNCNFLMNIPLTEEKLGNVCMYSINVFLKLFPEAYVIKLIVNIW